MLETHDFIRIRFQDEPRHKKPIGIHWLQAAATAAVGASKTNHIWPYRIPSLFGATVAVLLTFLIGRVLFDPRAALLGAALLAGSILLVVEAHQATTDAVLLVTVVVAQGTLGFLYTSIRRGGSVKLWIVLTFWIAQGAGMLVKGPIVPMVSLLTILSLLVADRSVLLLRQLRLWWGIPLALAIFSPWAIAVSLATKGTFFQDAIRSDLLPKLISGHESHGFIPGYYLLLVVVTFWPGSLFAGLAVIRAWKNRSSVGERFCLAWLIPAWLVFEIVPTKLPHYVMPTYPALALLTSQTIFAISAGLQPGARSRWFCFGFNVWSVVGLVFAAGFVAIPWVFDKRFEFLSLWPVGIAILIVVLARHYVRSGRLVAAMFAAVALSPLMLAPTFHLILSNVDGLWLSRSVARAVDRYERLSAAPRPVVAAVGYDEPSLVFLLGTETKLVSAEQAALYLRDQPEGLALVREKEDEAFRRSAAKFHRPVQVVETLHGFNYTKGRWLTVKLYSSKEDRAKGERAQHLSLSLLVRKEPTSTKEIHLFSTGVSH
jgi:4-amino-4-deoxy-L-arabinose transferase-like glycosyltransferase